MASSIEVDQMAISLDAYRQMPGIERSSERLPAGSQPNSDLVYRNADQQYRSEQLNLIQSTWLNPLIPWKVYITVNTRASGRSIEVIKDIFAVMLKMASYRHRKLMSAAIGVEQFPLSRDVHIHVAIASEAPITVEWFKTYLNRFQELRHKVLKYSAPAILSYVLKTTNTELINCEPSLIAPTTSQERRRLRRIAKSPKPNRLERLKAARSRPKDSIPQTETE